MHRSWLIIVAFGLLASACASDDAVSSADPATTASSLAVTTTSAPDVAFPVTIETPAGDVTIESPPQRIVSLSSTATETLFAIGAGDQVVAVDDASNYPDGAPQSDLNGFTVTAESLTTFGPDLVVYFFDPGDLATGLSTLGIPALFQPAPGTLDDALGQIEQLGSATGRRSEAEALTTRMRRDLDTIYSSNSATQPASYYYELDETLFTLTSTTFVGGLFAPLGLDNIADPADPDGFGYPQLSAEFIVDEDPDLIFLADTKCCGQSAETLAARPGWGDITAVVAGGVVELDDDVASRWGPRIVELVEAAAGAVQSFPGP